MLNEELLRAGLAELYAPEKELRHAATLLQAMQDARRQGEGFWAEGGLEMSPAEFRRARR